MDADKVSWNMSVGTTGNDLNAIFGVLNQRIEIIQQYLKENKLDGKATITVNSFSITDNDANV